MTCQNTRAYLDAWLDDELDVADALGLEQHVANCPECQRARQQAKALRATLRRPELRFQPPPGLDQKIHRSLAAKTESQFALFPNWVLAAAMVAILVFGGIYLTQKSHASRQEPIAAEVLASHIRSLQPGHLTDVLSTDRHTVKPWFQGKLDFAPPVPDPPTPDWVLIGGRLDYLDNRPVAALVYSWRKHTVNAFVWPAAEGDAPVQETLQGYHILHFTRDGMSWWIVSDLAEGELKEFGR